MLAALPEGSFEANRKVLEDLARAGNAEAAFRIAEVIAYCREYVALDNSLFDELLVRLASWGGQAVSFAGRAFGDQLNIDLMLESKAMLDAKCDRVGDLSAENAESAHAWMLRAASLGHLPAMAAYPAYAFASYTSHADLIDHADEVIVRRERARRWLEQSAAGGAPEALLAYANAHSEGGLLEHDPVRALAYLQAYAERSDVAAAVVRWQRVNLQDKLSPEQVAEAERLAARLLAGERPAGVAR